ncbi:hypothetical protein BSQ39_12990 [Loigolactobacillus backii]|uniref:phage baseplate upper protein n=1 Tax=Loigolactobacillus backii TaxID=375175 RepID=UPI000C1C9921|nr:phage baseplate upper protein [Loigolactobacillus backii]PIO80000.1 hypothetical protein BSQ39_12990 [Loigolactobacillus backii]
MEVLTFNVDKDRRGLVKDVQNFNLDFKDSKYNWIQARQYENQMRQAQVNVVHGDGTPLDLTGSNIVFEGVLPDETHRVIDGKHGVLIDPVNGQFRFDFPAQVFAIAGSYQQSFFRIYRDGQNIATLEFCLEVLADKVISGIVASDYITPFEDLYNQLADIVNNASGDLKTALADWQTKLQDLFDSLSKTGKDTADALMQVQAGLSTLETQIKADGLMTQADLDAVMKPLQEIVGNDNKSVVALQLVTDSLQRNGFIVNLDDGFANMSTLIKYQRPAGDGNVFQSGQLDQSTGLYYFMEQTDVAGTQVITEYNPKTNSVSRTRDLKLTEVVWLEGNSLFHDKVTGDLMFIVPLNLNGNWIIYNFDQDTKSTTFKLEGVPEYCIDASGQYFITTQELYGRKDSIGTNVQGFIIYDLASVMALTPKIVNYFSVKDAFVRGGNKIQGIMMIDNLLYIGRGSAQEWLRTTVIDTTGAIVADYNWDKSSMATLLGFEDPSSVMLESEGMSSTIINNTIVPVIVILAYNTAGAYYCLIAANDVNGTAVKYIAGSTLAELSRTDDTGKVTGLSITGGGPGTASILNQILAVKELGTYYFTVAEGNEGLAPEMASATGTAIVRQMVDFKPTKIAVSVVDYRNNSWSIYYDSGIWSRWAKTNGYVPLWKGSSALASAITLNKPVTGYGRIGVLYRTQSGELVTAYGDPAGVTVNATNNDGSAVAAAFYEATIKFTNDTSAIISASSSISLAVNSSGTTVVTRNNDSGITILEILGMM